MFLYFVVLFVDAVLVENQEKLNVINVKMKCAEIVNNFFMVRQLNAIKSMILKHGLAM